MEKNFSRVFIALSVILVAVIIWSIPQLEYSQVKLDELKVTSEAHDIYPTLRIEFRNEAKRPITKLRASINDVMLPYTFNVSKDNFIMPSKRGEYHIYTAWAVPGGGVEGYTPREGEGYKVILTIGYSNGLTETITKYDSYTKSKGVSIASIACFDTLYYDRADFLTGEEGSTVNIHFRNDWYQGDSQTVDRLTLIVGDEVVWDEKIRIKFANYFSITVPVPTRFTANQYYNVTLVAHSIEGNNSTFTRRILCQEK